MTDDEIVDPLSVPGHFLRRAQQVHTEAWGQLVPGVTGPQYAILVAVTGWPGLDQTRAGEIASLDKATATGIIGRLVAAGWIRRDPDPADRRRRLLELGPRALRELRDVTTAAGIVQDQLLSPVSPEEQERFVSALAAIARIDTSQVLGQRPDDRVLQMGRTPGYLIRRAQQLHASLWAEHVRDLTGPQYAVVATAIRAGTVSLAAIAAEVSLDTSSTGDIVQRLISHGWLETADNSEDRRSTPVRATRPARSAMRLLRTPVLDVQSLLLAPLEADLRESFVAALRSVARLDVHAATTKQ